MRNGFILATLLLILIITDQSDANYRRKRSYMDNFNVLLSIYKMNPLKHSNVFKTFSNRVLLPRPDEGHHDVNDNSNESTKKLNGTKETIPNVYYSQRTPVIDRPLHIKDKDEPEGFDPGHFLNKLISSNNLKTANDETETLIDKVDHVNLKNEWNVKSKHGLKVSEKHVNLRVFNLNKIDNDKIGFDNADVVVVK